MPQIYIMLSPHAQHCLSEPVIVEDFFKGIDTVATALIVSDWSVPSNDVACSGILLGYTRNEASVQIEIRYTSGNGLYKPKELFDPTTEMQHELNARIMSSIAPMLARFQLTCSVWCKPYQKSKFTMFEGLN